MEDYLSKLVHYLSVHFFICIINFTWFLVFDRKQLDISAIRECRSVSSVELKEFGLKGSKSFYSPRPAVLSQTTNALRQWNWCLDKSTQSGLKSSTWFNYFETMFLDLPWKYEIAFASLSSFQMRSVSEDLLQNVNGWTAWVGRLLLPLVWIGTHYVLLLSFFSSCHNFWLTQIELNLYLHSYRFVDKEKTECSNSSVKNIWITETF